MKTVNLRKISLENILGKLSKSQMKEILCGRMDASGSVTCPGGEVKSRDCGPGVPVHTSDTVIYCGVGNGDGIDMCKVS